MFEPLVYISTDAMPADRREQQEKIRMPPTMIPNHYFDLGCHFNSLYCSPTVGITTFLGKKSIFPTHLH